jgi:hypothetical protein
MSLVCLEGSPDDVGPRLRHVGVQGRPGQRQPGRVSRQAVALLVRELQQPSSARPYHGRGALQAGRIVGMERARGRRLGAGPFPAHALLPLPGPRYGSGQSGLREGAGSRQAEQQFIRCDGDLTLSPHLPHLHRYGRSACRSHHLAGRLLSPRQACADVRTGQKTLAAQSTGRAITVGAGPDCTRRSTRLMTTRAAGLWDRPVLRKYDSST